MHAYQQRPAPGMQRGREVDAGGIDSIGDSAVDGVARDADDPRVGKAGNVEARPLFAVEIDMEPVADGIAAKEPARGGFADHGDRRVGAGFTFGEGAAPQDGDFEHREIAR